MTVKRTRGRICPLCDVIYTLIVCALVLGIVHGLDYAFNPPHKVPAWFDILMSSLTTSAWYIETEKK